MKRLLLISMIALICSCSADRDWEHTEPELVVEGWIEAGRAPVVMVTTSVSPSREFRTVGQLQDHIVKWGKVSISSPDTTVILFGKTDKDYYPPYIFTTGWIIGKAGETYTLNVEYEGMHASATTTVTAPEPLEGLSAVKVEGSDSLFTLVARLNNRSSEKKYYQIFTKVEGKDSFFVPAFPGAIDGSGIADNAEIIITQGRSIERRNFSSNFVKGDLVHVRFCTMDEQSWRIWADFDAHTSLGDSPIFPLYRNPATNINGGLGYWAGYGSTYYSIEIE